MKSISLFPGLLVQWFVLFTSCSAKEGDDSFPSIPLIDLRGDRQEAVRQIHEACRTVGFFMIQNHGLDTNTIDKAWKASQAFFDLPEEEKIRHKTTNEVEYPYGYEQSEKLTKGKQLDVGDDDEDATVDLKETFAIGPNNLNSGMPLRRWIDTPSIPTFRQALEDYYSQMEDLALKLLEMFALALEEPPDFFLDKMDHHMSALRLVDYYPLPQQKTDMVRAGAHTDYGALTILNAQDPGLQVLLYDKNRTNTQWYSVPVVSGSLVINLGDLMQRWTNGM
jgi:isopenicillin N synthase-like dioxygenase